MPTATVTSKGQITIPQPVRERLRLKAGDRVDFVFSAEGSVTLKPKRIPFEHVQGILRTSGQKPVSVRDMDNAIEKSVRARWARKTRSQSL
jgi:antitoxin PrlF